MSRLTRPDVPPLAPYAFPYKRMPREAERGERGGTFVQAETGTRWQVSLAPSRAKQKEGARFVLHENELKVGGSQRALVLHGALCRPRPEPIPLLP
jgi:hypothetical protein